MRDSEVTANSFEILKIQTKYSHLLLNSLFVMVNYCCVFGCGRNSRSSKHLFYYTAPKELHRQEQWLEAAGRADILNKAPEKRIAYRFCSRHFSPASVKNKHLCADAVPTLCLPGSEIEDPKDDSDNEKQVHSNITCNHCGNCIKGFRYRCVTCVDYDLCSRCEVIETHSQHYMLRIPAPTKFKKIDKMIKKWQQYYKDTNTDNNDGSSDDEPITKYVKNYDSGIDLSEDVKESIRKEVTRALTQKTVETKKNKKAPSRKRPSETEKSSKLQKIETVDLTALFSNALFTEVEEIHTAGTSQQMDVKNEMPVSFESNLEPTLPLMEMKLSEDLSELMMEVTDQKSMF